MTATQMLFLIAGLWALVGVAASIVMGRRGHNPFAWLLLGAILGPLVIPVAQVAVRDERTRQRREVVSGSPSGGSVDILVGIDGSPESETALHVATTLFETRIGRLTLVSVEDFDSSGSRTPLRIEERAVEVLERMASSAEAQQPGAVILTGRPADALMQHAIDEGYKVIVIGRRGRGATNAVMGSTASRLARGSDVPVLIV